MQNVVNKLSFQITAQAASEHLILQSLCDLWDTALTTGWAARHSDQYTLVGIKAFNLSGAAKQPGFKAIDEPGAVVGTDLPAAVCRTITLYTASVKYRRRGRVQLSGSQVAMFNVADGAVTEVEITALETLADLLFEDVTGDGNTFAPVIPANAVDPVEGITGAVPRRTPSLIRSRRVKQFLIG